MKSLQLRFFVVVWLFVVAAMVALALLVGRWSITELERVSVETRIDRRLDSLTRSLIGAVEAVTPGDSVGVSAALGRITAADSMLLGGAVLDRDGRVLGTSIPDLAADALQLRGGGMVSYAQSVTKGSATQRIMVAISGHPFGTASAPKTLVLIPALKRSVSSSRLSGRSPSEELSRRIAIAVLVGSLLSALVTALIARPLLGRVGALSRATAALREGKLDSRVEVRGDDEVAELGRSFNALAEELGASEAQRRQMVTDVAHELRTPLTNIIGLVEAVRDGLRAPDDSLMLALQEEAGLLNQLVDDLRDLSLADAGELPLSLEALSAAEELRRTAAAFPPVPGEATIEVSVGEDGLTVRADRRRLGQILRNLVQNARRYSPDGGTVTLSASRVGEMVRLAVADTGIGIAPEHLPHVWERFYRVDGSRAKSTGGMGLGLALVSRLAAAQGGRVGVVSEAGRGSTFWVELPLPGSTRALMV
ncbi:MAG: ATP-binding protein [Gemmatimonadota bacterium]